MARSREEGLRELLTRVHERLRQAGTVDPESRRLLVTLTRDIERALGSQSGAPDGGQDRGAQGRGGQDREGQRRGGQDRGVRRESVSTLEALAARFDADHSALAQTLRQLIDFLAKGGV